MISHLSFFFFVEQANIHRCCRPIRERYPESRPVGVGTIEFLRDSSQDKVSPQPYSIGKRHGGLEGVFGRTYVPGIFLGGRETGCPVLSRDPQGTVIQVVMS